jgi:glucose-1-phosphate thymidylyltransferase
LIAMCLYYFPKEKLKLIRQYIKIKAGKKDATGFYIDWLRKKEPVYANIFKKQWYDIGDPQIYREAKENYGNA